MYDELVKRLREHNGWALNETLDQAADAIEELNRENESLAKSVNEASEILRKRWIPVTERLPEPHTRVLAWRWSEDLNRHYHTVATRLSYGEWTFDGVTHWMPLPEPPKEET